MNFIWPKSNKLETQSCHSISRDEPSRDFTDKRKFVEQIQNCTSIHLRIVRCSLLRRTKAKIHAKTDLWVVTTGRFYRFRMPCLIAGRLFVRKTGGSLYAKRKSCCILGQFFYYPCLSYHFSYSLLEGITPMANLQRIFLFFVSDGLQRHSIYFWCSARCSFSSSSRSAPKGQR